MYVNFLLVNNIWIVKLEYVSMNLLFTSLIKSSTIILSIKSNNNTTQSVEFFSDVK